eukprot:scaffold2547_cov299-Prasinococcus_capsulatus_cf.AAC.3
MHMHARPERPPWPKLEATAPGLPLAASVARVALDVLPPRAALLLLLVDPCHAALGHPCAPTSPARP